MKTMTAKYPGTCTPIPLGPNLLAMLEAIAPGEGAQEQILTVFEQRAALLAACKMIVDDYTTTPPTERTQFHERCAMIASSAIEKAGAK